MLALALALSAACAARAELQLSSSTYSNADFVAETVSRRMDGSLLPSYHHEPPSRHSSPSSKKSSIPTAAPRTTHQEC